MIEIDGGIDIGNLFVNNGGLGQVVIFSGMLFVDNGVEYIVRGMFDKDRLEYSLNVLCYEGIYYCI